MENPQKSGIFADGNEEQATKNRPLGVGGELRKIALCECYRTGHRADCISYTDTNIFPRGFRTVEFVFEHRRGASAVRDGGISIRDCATERRRESAGIGACVRNIAVDSDGRGGAKRTFFQADCQPV